MRPASLVLATVLVLAWLLPADSARVETVHAVQPLRIVVLGDSNAVPNSRYLSGPEWPSLMLRELENRFPAQTFSVVNSSQNGWSARTFLEGRGTRTLESLCLDHDPDVVVVAVGTNDAYGTASPPDPDEAVATYRASLTELIAAIEAHTSPGGSHPVVVLSQPPAAMDASYGSRDGKTGFLATRDGAGDVYPSGRPAAVLEALRDEAEEIAYQHGLPCIPAYDGTVAIFGGWAGETNERVPGLVDGVHLTEPVPAALGTWAADAVSETLTEQGEVRSLDRAR